MSSSSGANMHKFTNNGVLTKIQTTHGQSGSSHLEVGTGSPVIFPCRPFSGDISKAHVFKKTVLSLDMTLADLCFSKKES